MVDGALALESGSPGPNFGFVIPAGWAWAIYQIHLSHSFFNKAGIIICYRFTVRVQLGNYMKRRATWSISAFFSWFSPQAICKVYLVCLLKFLFFLNFAASHIRAEQCWSENLGDVQRDTDTVRFSMERSSLVVRNWQGQQGGRSWNGLYVYSRKGQRFLTEGWKRRTISLFILGRQSVAKMVN